MKTVTGKIKKMKEDDLQANQANVQLQGIYIYILYKYNSWYTELHQQESQGHPSPPCSTYAVRVT